MKTQKNQLRNAIEKAKSSKTKEKVLDALIIIAEIIFFPLICYAIRRIIKFNTKHLMSPLKKIRKAIFVLNDKKIRGAEKTDTEPK